MALVEEGPHSWSWTGVTLPRAACSIRSRMLMYQNKGWFLLCRVDLNGNVYLSLESRRYTDPKFSPFTITVEVLGSSLTSSTLVQDSTSLIIWQRKISEVEQLYPIFRFNHLLTFWICFEEQNPLNNSNSAPMTVQPSTLTNQCTQPAMPSKTYVDTSVQTSLTTNSILCLDALSEDFAKMMDANSNLDVDIHCDGHSTRAHKSVLSSRSPVLAKMLQTDMVEGRTGVINIQDMDSDIFCRFLRYLYTGKLDDTLTFDSAMALYEAGDMYGVISLKRLCSEFLRNKLTVENACEVLVVADAHADSSFAEAVTAYILEKEIPQSSDQWPAFCERNPVIAFKVLNRIVRR